MERNANHDVQLDLEFLRFDLTRMCCIVCLLLFIHERTLIESVQKVELFTIFDELFFTA